MAESINSKVVIDSFDYKLYFGKNISDSSKELIELPPLHGKLNSYIKTGEKDKYSIVLSGMKFTRKIYEPGTIEAEVTIKPVSVTETQGSSTTTYTPTLSFSLAEDLFSMRQVEMVVVNTTGTEVTVGSEKTTVYDNNETTIAKNYYVYQINPQIVSNSGKMEMYVKLTINSFDKLTAIDKYCKAFTSKKLASDILKKEVANFGFKSHQVNAEVGNLHHLKYDTDKEMMQPYLVQYNESFYDFMVRTANRCGEFFYFEDGQLTLGLPSTSNPENIDSFTSVTMQGYTPGPISVDSFTRDSAKLNDLEKEKEVEYDEFLNADPIDSDSKGIPKDSFLGNLQYNNPLATDEYIFPLKKDSYTSLNRELCLQSKEAAATTLLGIASSFVGITDGDVLNAGIKLGSKMAADATKAAILNKQAQNKTNKNYTESEHCDGNTLVSFSSVSSSGWIDNEFYTNIRKREEAQHRKIICIDMGTKYVPVKLGETIYVNNLTDKYIVVGINLIANMTWQHEYRKFDPTDHTTDLYSKKQSQVIYAIPVRTETKPDKTELKFVMPPVAPVPMMRKSGPLTAFVTDNDDKKYQGRVRIAFPWQSPNEEKRKALYEAVDSLKNSQKELSRLQDLLKSINDWIKYKAILSEVYTKYYDILKEIVTEKEEEITDDPLKNTKKTIIIYTLSDKKEDLDAAKENLDAAFKELEETKQKNLKRLNELEMISLAKKKTQTKDEYDEWYKTNKDELEKLKQQNERIDEILEDVFCLQGSNADLVEAYKKIKAKQEQLANDQTLEDQKKKAKEDIEEVKKTVATKEAEVAKRADNWGDELKGISSPWVRVAMPLATQGGGAYFKPNVGDEVLVNFDSDNIERPYVVGSVFSKNHVAPGEGLDRFAKNFLQKKAQIALMSSNGHHIAFTAPTDGWKFIQSFSPFLKSLQTYVPEAKGEDVLTGDFKDTCGGIYMGDRYGMYEIAMSSHDRKIKVNSPYGNVEIGAFTGITVSAPNGDIKISGKNVTIEAGNKLELHSGTNITDDKGVYDEVMKLIGTLGDQFIDGTFGDFLKLADLSIVRSLMEVLLRPIDGTLNVKSNNYLMLESGQGQVQVPLDRYAPHYQKQYKMEETAKQIVYGKIAEYIRLINASMLQFEREYTALKTEAYIKKAAYERALGIWNGEGKPDVYKLAFKLAITDDYQKAAIEDNEVKSGTIKAELDEIKNDKVNADDNGHYKNNDDGTTYNDFNDFKRSVIPVADAYGLAVSDLHKKAASVKTLFNADECVKKVNLTIAHVSEDADTKWIDQAFKAFIADTNNGLQSIYDPWKERYGDLGADPTADFLSDADKSSADDPYQKNSLINRRKLIANFLYKIYGDPKNAIEENIAILDPNFKGQYFDLCIGTTDGKIQINDDNLKNHWADIAALEAKQHKPKSKGRKVAEGFMAFFGLKKRLEFYTKQAEGFSKSWFRHVWNDSKNGQILFSSEKGVTYEFKDGAIHKLDLVSNSNIDMLRDLLKSIK